MADEVATEDHPVEVEVPAPLADGVAVVVTYNPDGSFALDVQTLGTTRLTEADTILSKGRALLRERLGIN
jgi:hypothetical protein